MKYVDSDSFPEQTPTPKINIDTIHHAIYHALSIPPDKTHEIENRFLHHS
jgi:hypothetical protein